MEGGVWRGRVIRGRTIVGTRGLLLLLAGRAVKLGAKIKTRNMKTKTCSKSCSIKQPRIAGRSHKRENFETYDRVLTFVSRFCSKYLQKPLPNGL